MAFFLSSYYRYLRSRYGRKPLSRVALKTISLALALIFCSEQLIHAAPTAPTHLNAILPTPTLTEIIRYPSKLEIPFEHVTLKEVYHGTNDRLIIHIQDAHANYSGQKSLAGALDHLMEKYGISLVLSEGSAMDRLP